MVILQLDQQPILIQAIFTGDVEEVRAALEFKQDVNYQDCEKRSPLHAAAFKGSADIASVLLSYGARVNTKDNRWITPLHRACCCGSSELVSLLLRYQADTTARDRQWQTPLHVAAANNAVECVEQLLECVPNFNVTDRMGRTALHHAAVNGHNDVLELLLSKGCIVNACDKKDCRPLHCASHMGHVDTIELLLRNGSDINAKDRNQYSPLHVAASSGMVSACRVLLRSGAEVDARNAYGNMPLHIACLNGHLPVCNVLVSFGANIEATNYRGQTPLHIAAASTHGVDCLNFLVDQKANINKQSLDGRSPLHMTAIHGRFTRSKTLIDKGAIVDCTDKNSCTALHIAAQYGHDILSNTLLVYGADPSKKGYSGRTPLHMSSLSGYVECCRKFLQAGVNLNAVDDSGKTPIHCAAYKGSVECLDLLVSNGADFHLLDNIGRTPLHYAAVQGHYPCVFTLVGLGSNVNLCDLEGCSPLHLAAAYDIKGECVEYLLRHKADSKLKDSKGFTPIHYAVTGGNLAGLGFLLSAVGNNYIMYGSDMPLTTPLHLAARNGNHDILQLLLSYFHDINIRTEHGSTALLLAAKAGNTHCVQMLLRYGSKVSITDTIQHMGPVHYSARNGHMHCLALLLDNAEDKNVIDKPDSLQRTALMMAVAGGHTDSAHTLLKCGADPNIVDAEKHSSLFRAVVNGQQNTVQLLLSSGAVVDKPDIHGKTVLHLAAASGHLSSLQTVINTMDSLVITALDNQGCTALHWACYNGNPNCVLFLLEKKIFKELEGNVFSPIHCATFVGAERCIELLCNNYGTDIVQLKDARNRTPLHIAALHGHVDCAKFLLEKGAEIECKDADDRTPLVAAAQNGQTQIIDILLSYKADVMSYDHNGNTALHLACLKRHSHSALLLLENIDDVDAINMINNDKKTPLHLSARNGLVNVTRQLISKGSSVLAVDANGMTPALCCAPNSSVAQCLALILANYAICSQQNKEISICTSSPSSKRTSNEQTLQKSGNKKKKTYQTQDSQTELSLLRDPDYFECQRMSRRHCHSPSRVKKKRPSEVSGAKVKKPNLKTGIPSSMIQSFCKEGNCGGCQEYFKNVACSSKNNFFTLENYKSEEQLKEARKKKVGHDLHHSYSDMLIAQNMNQYSLATFNKIMHLAKTKKNLKPKDLKLLTQRDKFLHGLQNDKKINKPMESLLKFNSNQKQQLTNTTNKNIHKTTKEINRNLLESLVKNKQKVENINSTNLKTEFDESSSSQINLLDSDQEGDRTRSLNVQEHKLNQIFEETMQQMSQQKRFLQSERGLNDSKPVRAQSMGQLMSEGSISENRMQKIWKTYANQVSNKNLKTMLKLQQKKGLLNMQSFSEKSRATESGNISETTVLKTKPDESNTCNAMANKEKIDDTVENCTSEICGVVLDDNCARVEEIYFNCKKTQEFTKLAFVPIPNPKLKIIETASDDEIVKVDQVMQREQLLEETEIEKVHSSSKKFRDKTHFLKQTDIDAQSDKSENFIREGLKIMKSTKNLVCVSQHVHMLNSVLNKCPRNIPHAVEIMKHILSTLQEHEWLEKQNGEAQDNRGKLKENIVAVELFERRDWDDIYKTTEELAIKMQNISQMKQIEVQHEHGKDFNIKNEDNAEGFKPNPDAPEDGNKHSITNNSNNTLNLKDNYSKTVEDDFVESNKNDTIKKEESNIDPQQQDENKNFNFEEEDLAVITIKERNCYSDTTVYKLPKLTTFNVEPTEITSNTSLIDAPGVKTETGSVNSLTQENETCDSNLYNFYLEELLNDIVEIQPDGSKKTENHTSKTENETEVIEPHVSNQFMSGTISLVSHLSVQKEMEMTLESIDAMFDKDCMKSHRKEQELLEDLDKTIISVKTLYINQNKDQEDIKETVMEDESTQLADQQLYVEKQQFGASSDISDAQKEEKLIENPVDVNEKTLLQESNSNDALGVEKCLKSGKKNSNIVKKKRTKSKESLQCCIS